MMNFDEYLTFVAGMLKRASNENNMEEYKRLTQLTIDTCLDVLRKLENDSTRKV